MRVEDFPLVMPGFRYLVPEGVAADEIAYVRFLDGRSMLRGLGFGPNVDIVVMSEQIEFAFGVRAQFCPAGQARFYSFSGDAT